VTPAQRHAASHGATRMNPSEVQTVIATLKAAIEADDDGKVKEGFRLLISGMALNLARLANPGA